MAKQYPYTKEELIDYLLKMRDELGRKPVKKDIPDEMKPYFRVFFGKWCYALEAAGIVIPSERALARRQHYRKRREMKRAEKKKEVKTEQ